MENSFNKSNNGPEVASSTIMHAMNRLEKLIAQTKEDLAYLEHKLMPITRSVEEVCEELQQPQAHVSCDFHHLLVRHEEALEDLQSRIIHLGKYCEL